MQAGGEGEGEGPRGGVGGGGANLNHHPLPPVTDSKGLVVEICPGHQKPDLTFSLSMRREMAFKGSEMKILLSVSD